MTQEISNRNTKNQILEAYEELLKKVQEQKSEEPKKVQEEARKKKLLAKHRKTPAKELSMASDHSNWE